MYYDNDTTRKYAAVGAYFLDLLERPLDFVDSKEKVEEILSNIKNANYEKGLSDAWKCITKIYGLQFHDIEEIYGKDNDTLLLILGNFAPKEAIDKLKVWEEKQKIKVGDMVSIDCKVGEHIVTWKNSETRTLHCMSLKTGGFSVTTESKVKKTGKHIDLTEIFKGLEGEDEDR